MFKFIKNIIDQIRGRETLPFKDGDRYIAMIKRPIGGGQEMHIEGAKYPLMAAPRDFVLSGPLKPFKKFVDKVIRRYLLTLAPMEIPVERLSVPVRELYRCFMLLAAAEVSGSVEGQEGMRQRWMDYGRALCFFLNEDDAYLYRLMWMLERMDMKKMRLTKANNYYFRVKPFHHDMKEIPKEFLEKYGFSKKTFL